MCDTVVVVGDDGVMFAKNSDRDPNEAQVVEWIAAADHEAGSTVRCTEVEVAQVAHTHTAVLSRPFWMWGAEMGANEHGVVIGNEAVWTNQPYAETGLLGMDLLRLALERARSAHEAVEVIVSLIEAHGQGGGHGFEERSFTYHNSFLVADPERAVVLETAGRRWATEEVRSGVRSISNALTIEGFAAEFGDRSVASLNRSAARQACTASAAEEAAGIGDLMALLRSHGNGSVVPHYEVEVGAMAAPCMHGGGTVVSSQTTGSWVSDLADSGRHWVTASAAPCTSVFKPVTVEEPIDQGPSPLGVFDSESRWWRHELLHRSAMRAPDRLLVDAAAERASLESELLLDPSDTAGAWDRADEAERRWTATAIATMGGDERPPTVAAHWAAVDRAAGMPWCGDHRPDDQEEGGR